jgi:protoporphyrinogen oxidase
VWWREVSAYSVWHWLSKSHPARPVLGALRGGGALMAADLVDSIEARGGEVWVNAPVTRIEEEAAWVRVDSGPVVERFDSVISTLPLEDLSSAACGYLRRNIPAPAAPRCGRVTASLELDRPLARVTRTVAPGTDTPFLELVETTHVAPPAWLGGRTLVEARGWGGGDSSLFREPETVLREQAAAFLRRLFPRFDPGLIRSIRIDREPDAEPVWTTGSFERLPTRRAGHTQVFLCQPEHVYPGRLGWESALRLAKETVTDLCVDMLVANRHASDVLA